MRNSVCPAFGGGWKLYVFLGGHEFGWEAEPQDHLGKVVPRPAGAFHGQSKVKVATSENRRSDLLPLCEEMAWQLERVFHRHKL